MALVVKRALSISPCVFSLVSRPPFQNEKLLRKLRSGSPKQQKNREPPQKKLIVETHRLKDYKRTPPGMGQTFEIEPSQNFQLFSQRPRALKVQPKRKPTWTPWVPKLTQNRTTRTPRKQKRTGPRTICSNLMAFEKQKN